MPWPAFCARCMGRAARKPPPPRQAGSPLPMRPPSCCAWQARWPGAGGRAGWPLRRPNPPRHPASPRPKAAARPAPTGCGCGARPWRWNCPACRPKCCAAWTASSCTPAPRPCPACCNWAARAWPCASSSSPCWASGAAGWPASTMTGCGAVACRSRPMPTPSGSWAASSSAAPCCWPSAAPRPVRPWHACSRCGASCPPATATASSPHWPRA